jgi:hypothetical protein
MIDVFARGELQRAEDRRRLGMAERFQMGCQFRQ